MTDDRKRWMRGKCYRKTEVKLKNRIKKVSVKSWDESFREGTIRDGGVFLCM